MKSPCLKVTLQHYTQSRKSIYIIILSSRTRVKRWNACISESSELLAPESYTALTKNYYKDASTLIKHLV